MFTVSQLNELPQSKGKEPLLGEIQWVKYSALQISCTAEIGNRQLVDVAM